MLLETDRYKPSQYDRVFTLQPYQDRFIFSSVKFPALVAAWGTGKTFCLIQRAMHHSTKYRNNLGIIFRREFTDLRDSTIKDFEQYTGLKVDSSRECRLPNGSIIMFRHLEEMRNLQNINLGWFGIEQGEELETDDQFMILFGRLRRAGVPHWGAVIANTNGHNWIYRNWKIGELKESELIEAKTADNAKNLPADFLQTLEQLKEKKPIVYKRFVLNSWDDADTSDVVIRPEWIEKARQREIVVKPPIRGVISIDVARFGNDKTTFYAIENNRVVDRMETEKEDTMKTVGRAILFGSKHGINSFAPDEIGVGAGVVDRLVELGKDVIPVNSSKKSAYPDKYYNVRAEIYDFGAQLFQDGLVQIQSDDRDLIDQLSWAKYKTIKSNGILQIEAKEDIKERYGRSPDNADAFLNGLWAAQKVNVFVVGHQKTIQKGWVHPRYRQVA